MDSIFEMGNEALLQKIDKLSEKVDELAMVLAMQLSPSAFRESLLVEAVQMSLEYLENLPDQISGRRWELCRLLKHALEQRTEMAITPH